MNTNLENIQEIINNSDYVFTYTYGTFMSNNKDYKRVIVTEDSIFTIDNDNVNVENNKDKADKVWQVITVLTGAIIECSEKSKELSHIKDSSKDEITLKMKDKNYLFSNKVNDEQLNNIYKNIVDKILSNL